MPQYLAKKLQMSHFPFCNQMVKGRKKRAGFSTGPREKGNSCADVA